MASKVSFDEFSPAKQDSEQQKNLKLTKSAFVTQASMVSETNAHHIEDVRRINKINSCTKFKNMLEFAIDNNYSQVIMTLVTVYALVADDIKLLTTDVSADGYFTTITIFSLVMFLLELIAASIGKPGYWLSFFFWLDLIATLSIITDIGPLMELMTGDGNGAAGADTVTLARASRGARIGTRAGRMARVIRLIRLVRVVKLYKSANQAMTNQEGSQMQQKMDEINQMRN